MRLTKMLGKLGAAALVAGLIPYRFESDKETGSYEVGGMLWTLKKTAGEENDTYSFELFPFAGQRKQTEETAETPAEETEEAAEEAEVAAEEAEEIVEEVVIAAEVEVAAEEVEVAAEEQTEPEV